MMNIGTFRKRAGMCEHCDQRDSSLLVEVKNYLICKVCAVVRNDANALGKFQ